MFDADARERVLRDLTARAESDPHVASAALLGSLTTDAHDRWSDLDLTLAVTEGSDLDAVVTAWTAYLVDGLGGRQLLDLTSGGLLYRVFLLPGWLQLDLSFGSGGRVLQGGPRLRLLFGEATEITPTPADPAGRLGYAVLWARHGFVCLRRGRVWQAAYCLGELRNAVMDLACLEEGLPARFGRGYDDLPDRLTERLAATVPAGLATEQLDAALRAAILLLAERPEAAGLRDDLEALARISA